jgi:hypothetical protein
MLTNLGTKVMEVGIPVEYIWIDLLTIPQEGDSIRRDKEVEKQASIFSKASQAIIWMNDIESWTRTEALLHWSCLHIVQAMGLVLDRRRKDALQSHLSVLSEKACHPIELCAGESLMLQNSNPWFSSLWTLQEAFLRPDMWLANKYGELLEISKHHPISLIDLVSTLDFDFCRRVASRRQVTSYSKSHNETFQKFWPIMVKGCFTNRYPTYGESSRMYS